MQKANSARGAEWKSSARGAEWKSSARGAEWNKPVRVALLGAVAACACTAPTGAREGNGPGLGTGEPSEGKGSSPGPEEEASDEGGEDGSSTSEGEVKYDVGAIGGADLPPTDGGCDKVDFLFVIDNSTSMHNEQAALVAAYDDFMMAIQTSVSGDDYHVMVVDTDARTRCTKNACDDDTPSAPIEELCLDPADGYACKTNFSACDETLGAGVVHPAGDEASNQMCPIVGKRYLDGTDDLIGTFGCVARVGTAGDASERPMDAMQAALVGGGGCNGDFLRDDAILVVTFLTDDPCYEDTGTAASWYQSVVAAKGGNAEAIVVLGIVPSLVCHYNPDSCDSAGDAIGGAHWAEFVAMWGDAGLLGDVCSPDGWPALFASAVSVIDATCDAFEPPG
jgi:hypothetical protein